MLRLHADRVALSARERRLQERFSGAHPQVPVVEVAAQPGDVHDLDGLRSVGEDLAGGDGRSRPGLSAGPASGAGGSDRPGGRRRGARRGPARAACASW